MLQVKRLWAGRAKRARFVPFPTPARRTIGVVVYLRQLNERNEAHVSFVFGQSRVAPAKPTAIPRLELCGAVLSTQAIKKVLRQIDLDIDEVSFYAADSKVLLGYIQNEARWFAVYGPNEYR